MNCKHCTVTLSTKSREKYCSLKCKLLSNVQYENDCWLWTINHGRIRFNSKWHAVWKVSHELYKGSAKNRRVSRICENFKCVRPEHLLSEEIIKEQGKLSPELPSYKKFILNLIKDIKDTFNIGQKEGI